MLMHEVQFPDGTPIDGYGPGSFRIGGFVHRGGLLILPGRIGQWTPAEPPAIEDFAAVMAAGQGIDVLLVGLGADVGVFPRAVREAIEATGPGVDVMGTPAACRTFNVLLAENRRVAAALLPVPG